MARCGPSGGADEVEPLMEAKIFDVKKHTVKNGEPVFSSRLTLRMSKKHALQLLAEVANTLQDEDDIEILLFGEMQDEPIGS